MATTELNHCFEAYKAGWQDGAGGRSMDQQRTLNQYGSHYGMGYAEGCISRNNAMRVAKELYQMTSEDLIKTDKLS